MTNPRWTHGSRPAGGESVIGDQGAFDAAVTRTPDPLLAAAMADGSHALAVEDRETEIRQAIEGAWLASIARSTDECGSDAILDAAVGVAAAREAALQARVVEFVAASLETDYTVDHDCPEYADDAAEQAAALANITEMHRLINVGHERLFDAHEAWTAKDQEIQRLREYAETTRYHQQKHADAVRETAALQARIDAVRAVVDSHEGDAPGSPMYPLWRAVRAAAHGDTTEAGNGAV